ncbi:uncharacterized protein EV420DRAFT_1554545 [Desarmillaria tabescens]|uniref:F-box domain-containing protein n=1 Tax=Armillaria tabescens TaxID=1929756 RepID=A0AA39N264_ARMTA|nr:uncharacterized protein EV420DRAFT_1554545 [Desarmillaria tabescens]KAK0455177.1 hypothetical protein EV420DRAFT_1554545 [Desarmillaria tabescens]
MSAKLHLRRNTKPTSVELPPEIWSLIFDLATQVPGAYDPDCLALAFTHPPSKFQIQETKKSLSSRSRLIRVCKLWSIFALKNLFEHITVVRDASIVSLRDKLVRSREDAGTGHHLGCYTKRLDISLKTSDINKTITNLSDIIRCLPNLSFIKIFLNNTNRPVSRFNHGRDNTAVPDPFLDALCLSCPSLQVLEILPRSSFYIPHTDLHRIFSSFPKLSSFRNDGDMYHLLTPGESCLHLAASVTTVAINDLYFKSIPVAIPPDPSTFPLLQTAIFYTMIRAERQFSSFIQIHGSTLTTIMIRFSKTSTPQDFFCGVLRTIGTSCPGVINFMIWFDTWNWFEGPAGLTRFHFPPSIRVFGIRCKDLQADSWTYERFLLRLDPENGRILRLLDERHVKDLCQKHTKTFKSARRRLEPGGWQFQGPDERSLL